MQETQIGSLRAILAHKAAQLVERFAQRGFDFVQMLLLARAHLHGGFHLILQARPLRSHPLHVLGGQFLGANN
eukprot:scaffold1913_cov257-Pinguiococcus_pyrenoidosus.AAC.43